MYATSHEYNGLFPWNLISILSNSPSYLGLCLKITIILRKNLTIANNRDT